MSEAIPMIHSTKSLSISLSEDNTPRASILGKSMSVDFENDETFSKYQESFWKPLFFFMACGFLSRSVDFTMIAKIDDFDKKYDGFNYRFVVGMPNYLMVPVSFLLIRMLQLLRLEVKIGFCVFGTASCLTACFVCIFLLDNSL